MKRKFALLLVFTMLSVNSYAIQERYSYADTTSVSSQLSNNDLNEILNEVESMYTSITFEELGMQNITVFEISYNTVKSQIRAKLTQIINSDKKISNKMGQTEDKEFYKGTLELNKIKIMRAMVYLNALYSFNNYDGQSIYDIIIEQPNYFGGDYDIIPMLVHVGNGGKNHENLNNLRYSASIKSENGIRYSQTNISGYDNVIKPIITSNLSFEDFFKKIAGTMDVNDWFSTKTNLKVKENMQNNMPTTAKWRAFDRLISDENTKKYILPLLNIPSGQMYVMSNSRHTIIGPQQIYNGYDFNAILDKYGDRMSEYLNLWYRIAIDSTNIANYSDSLVLDTIKTDRNWNTWPIKLEGLDFTSTEYIHNAFYIPFKLQNTRLGANGEANGNGMRLGVIKLLSDEGLSCYAHENAHVLVKSTFLDNKGERDNATAEVYTRSFLEPYEKDEPVFSFNQIFNRNELYSNTNPEQFNSMNDVDNFVKNRNELIYALDVLEAEAVFEKNYQKEWFNTIEQIPSNESGKRANSTKALFRNMTENEKNSLVDINSLVDRDAVSYRFEANGLLPTGTLENNAYETIPLFTPMYGYAENNSGMGSDITSKRLIWELWGEYGYYNGVVPYMSNQYKDETGLNDDALIMKITGKSGSEFKKSLYKKAQTRENQIKPIFINGTQITDYSQLKNLMVQAVENDKMNSFSKLSNGAYVKRAIETEVEKLKIEIYKQYKDLTSDFSDSIYSHTVTKLTKPAIIPEVLTYNGQEQSPKLNNIDYNTMTISGDKNINADDYTITISLKDKVNTTWDDDTTQDIILSYTINKRQGVIVNITGNRNNGTAGNETVADGYTVQINDSIYNPNNIVFNGNKTISSSVLGKHMMGLTKDMFTNNNNNFENVEFNVTDGYVNITDASIPKFTIKYQSNSDDIISDKTILFEDTIELPNLSKDGFDFDGYFYNNIKVEPNTTFKDLVGTDTIQNITLEARWKEKTHNISPIGTVPTTTHNTTTVENNPATPPPIISGGGGGGGGSITPPKPIVEQIPTPVENKEILTPVSNNTSENTITSSNVVKDYNSIENHWAKKYIDFSIAHKYFSDIIIDKFEPNKAITRGEFISVLGKFANIPEISSSNMFKDVSKESYQNKFISWASEKGIIKGYNNGYFKPNNNITRAEMAVILANYYKNITVPNSYNVDFKDNSKIPNWSKEAIKKVVYMKIMKGRTNSNFDPNQNITRAEIATIIYNMNNLK